MRQASKLGGRGAEVESLLSQTMGQTAKKRRKKKQKQQQQQQQKQKQTGGGKKAKG